MKQKLEPLSSAPTALNKSLLASENSAIVLMNNLQKEVKGICPDDCPCSDCVSVAHCANIARKTAATAYHKL